MKKISILLITAILSITAVAANAAEIPRESTPENATEEQIIIVENLIGDILDEVNTGAGYGMAASNANTRILKAVMAYQTDGYGYGILSAISQNALRLARDMYMRPEVYEQYEEYLKVLLADLIIDVHNGKDYNTTYEEARMRIYKSADAKFNPDTDMVGDFCYWNIPAVDSAEFAVARKLLFEAAKN